MDQKTKNVIGIVLAVLVLGGAFLISEFNDRRNARNAQGDGYSETVYTTPQGMEIRLCDDGIAYVDGSKGKWDRGGYVQLGNNGMSYIRIMMNGSDVYCSICRGRLYWGGHSVVVRDYPDGTPLEEKRR